MADRVRKESIDFWTLGTKAVDELLRRPLVKDGEAETSSTKGIGSHQAQLTGL